MNKKFRNGDLIEHVKTGSTYRVLHGPNVARIEKTDEPAYIYRSMHSDEIWVRPQAEMEDGRFKFVKGAMG